MMCEVDDTRHSKPACLKRLDNVAAALRSSARRQHWIEDDRAVMMKRYPVIREHCIRRVEFFLVFDHNDFNAGIFQAALENVELATRTPFDLFAIGIRDLSLKHERRRRIGVETE